MSYRQFDVVKTSHIASYTANNPKLDSQDARISIPPTSGGNWKFRYRPGVTNRYAIMTNQFDFSYSGLLPDVITPKWLPKCGLVCQSRTQTGLSGGIPQASGGRLRLLLRVLI